MIIRKYVKFIQSLQRTTKTPVQYLLQKVAGNVDTVTGKNVRFILDLTKQEDIFLIKPKSLKNDLKFCEIEANEKWRIKMIKEIVNIKKNIVDFDSIENSPSIEELEEILDFVCSS